MNRNAGPPPVNRSAVARTGQSSVAVENYATIVDTLKANNGAEARALRAMFGGNRQLLDRFLSVAFSLLAADSDLLRKATPMSIVEAIKKSASLGLEPMTDEAAIVCYTDKATLLPMFKGYLKRIRNSGKIRAVDAAIVYTEDEFDYGTNERGGWFTHHPSKARKDTKTGENLVSRGDFQGVYAYAVTPDGFTYFRYMDVDEVNHVRDTYGSQVTSSGKPLPWRTAYGQMALKTVIRLLAKMLPQEAIGFEFMELEKAADDAEQAARVEAKVDTALEEVRNLALRAVGAGDPPMQDDPGQADEQKPTEAPPVEPAPEGAPAAEATGPDPGADPNVAAAMQLADAQQEQLRRQRQK